MTEEDKTTEVTGNKRATKSASVFTQRVDEHTYLKQLQLKDAGDLFALTDSCRDYLRQWLPWVDSTKSVKDSETFISTTLSQAAGGNGFQAGIWHGGELVGVIGLHQVDSFNRTTSIGYWLGESFQGKGLMTKACHALTDYVFHKMRLNRVEIRCGVENKQSKAVPERLGFKQEGVIREGEWLYDHFIDHKVYGMLKSDWVSADQ